jgi:UDP:flavonoid glycosyltransferase YjiC (YdhE family)
MVEQAQAAAASEHDASDETAAERRHMGHDVPPRTTTNQLELQAELPDHPPPAYGDHFGHLANSQDGYDTKADVADDGRVNIQINQYNQKLSTLLAPALRHQQEITEQEQDLPPPYIPPSLGGDAGVPPPPPMNVVIQIVGSRGDVQPFVALGKVLKDTYGHRVRMATHPNFKDFVLENDLEFFNIGGDPSKLMAFMVKNPGLMPGFDSLRSGDVGDRRREVAEYLKGCWRSCFESGDGLGPEASDDTIEDWTSQSGVGDASSRPFVADCIIANPPSFAHIHCAEKLGLPLHIMFTMPYSPTQAFPHPLANIQSSNADANLTNYMSYSMIDMLTWQGLGDVINRFRQKTLGLEPVNLIWAPGMLQRLKIPHTYCWSPALIPKPKDWGQTISISGFFFLNLASNYTPAPDLKAFLDNGPPPVYIGFGSIVLDDPNAMTELIFEAVRITGQRVLLSKGWGGMGAEEIGMPDGVFMLGNVPHDWLFKHVSCVVHHGGAGTTAAGITAGRPTVVVPFFGDQPFWGSMVARAGAGPEPLPHKKLTGEQLADAINFCLTPECQERAKELASKIAQEKGCDNGAQSFHQMLDVDKLRCTVAPSRVAVWRVKRTQVRLSTLVACTLANEGLLDFNDLKLFRSHEFEAEDGPTDPISGGATAIVGTATQMMMGVADFPIETLKALKIHPETARRKKSSKEGDAGPSRSETDTTATSSDALTLSSSKESVGSGTAVISESNTPVTSRSSSAFNLQESLDRMQGQSSSGRLGPHSSSMSSALKGQLKDAKSRSRSGSRSRPESQPGAQPDYAETAMDTTKGVGRILGAGFKSPLDFSMAVTKGFHNAPKLYGDDTVRKTDQVTDFKSGQKVAWKEFGLGLYDGISGLVTQPVRGARKEGAAGLVKGFGKGLGGIMLKPAAAGFGIAGYTMKGMYMEMQKNFGASVQNYIIAARTAQGYEDWQMSTEAERRDIAQRWQAMQKDIKRKRDPDEIVKQVLEDQRKKGQTYLQTSSSWVEGKRQSGQSWVNQKRRSWSNVSSSNAPENRDPESAMLQMGAQSPDAELGSTGHAEQPRVLENDELQEAISQSVQQTSRGDPEEDAAVERAINASMTELARSRAERARQQTEERESKEQEDEDLKRAIAASVADADNHQQQRMVDDDELERALAESLREQRRQRGSDSEWDSDSDTIDNEGSSRAAQKSSMGTGSIGAVTQDPPEYDIGHVAGDTQSAFTDRQAQNPSEKTQQERNEEQVVMDYVKKQSLLEEQHRQAAAGKGGQTDENDEELERALKSSMNEHGSAGEASGS